MDPSLLLAVLFVIIIVLLLWDSVKRYEFEKDEVRTVVLFVAVLFPSILAYVYFEENRCLSFVIALLILAALIWSVWKSLKSIKLERIAKNLDKFYRTNTLNGLIFGVAMLIQWHLVGNLLFAVLSILWFAVSAFAMLRKAEAVIATIGGMFIILGIILLTFHDPLMKVFGVGMIMYSFVSIKTAKEVGEWKRREL
ncbi:hypothetical protein E3E31_09470 [Thermococcus sp. M39]|uniref:hypothetical protein n=1 Tax=Thermococcus sp. M39 TaxID=1638262 RepID=UPI00143BE651|nr:hypothetical protein [Thermococcus sp. M39]NJE08747.1 hypothetical protein [Thermococcus sp. M39]